MSFANLFKGKTGSDAETTPADRIIGVERETTRLSTEQTRLMAAIATTRDALKQLDEARRPLAFAAKVNGDVGAADALASHNLERRRLDDELRDNEDALAQLMARLDALGGEHRDAERARDEECIRRLADEQADLATKADAAFTVAVDLAREWVAKDLILTSHAPRLGLPAGRNLYARLSDVLSGHLYRILPPTYQANAVSLEINVTSAHRASTFEAMSAVHGPAYAQVRQPAAEKEKSA